MKKAELAELARFGVRFKLEQIERYLADMFADFPEEFATKTPPVFMRPSEKPGGNSWPAFTIASVSENGHGAEDGAPLTPTRAAAGWTPERRKQAALRAKQHAEEVPWGTFIWQKVHDYLLTRPERTATLTQMRKAFRCPESTVMSSLRNHTNLFTKVSRGGYRLTKVIEKRKREVSATPTRKAVAHHTSKKKKGTAPPKIWGGTQWQRIHDFLLTQPEQTAPLSVLMPACHVPSQGSAITGMLSHKDLFARVSQGTYRLKRALSAEEKLTYAPGR